MAHHESQVVFSHAELTKAISELWFKLLLSCVMRNVNGLMQRSFFPLALVLNMRDSVLPLFQEFEVCQNYITS